MDKQEVIKEVITIILKYARPTRIYLYGSQANGECTKTSDIDIAYEDVNFKQDYLIKEEVEKLTTLLKIDVKNISFTEDRFKNRVKDAGKVLYSANKKLRAEDSLLNFSKAYEKFANVVERKDGFYKEGYGDIYLDLVVKRFEFTYEMSWKTIKRYLDFIGIVCNNPRSCFKEAFSQELISDENIWIDMIEKRNLSSHIYDEDEISDILEKVVDYKNVFKQLMENIKKRLK